MVRMAAEGAKQQQIADELGYASAADVKTTLNRTYAMIREQFMDWFGYLF